MHPSFWLAAGLLGCGLATPLEWRNAPTATIASGVIHGTTSAFPSATVNKFLGIPFAKSPPERFSPPQDPAPWHRPLVATESKPACVQQFAYPEAIREFNERIFNNPGGPPPPESEDCLYLNVFAPSAHPPPGGWPVMFWIYGGNLQFGDAGMMWYDGSTLAANENVVVVTTNYRTNAFGFAGSPEIQAIHQNVGFLDQRKALAWVTENIRAFHGDPHRVTIFGESAGGWSVKQLLALPPSPLPFHAAIMESNGLSAVVDSGAAGAASWAALASAVGCADAASQLACVRNVDAATIKSVIEHAALSFPPTEDNVTCVADVRSSIASKRWADLPILIGSNANEGRVFATQVGISPNASQAEIAQYLNATFPNNTELHQAILAAYPAWLTTNAYQFISQIITDADFTCTTRILSNYVAAAGYKAWRYQFNGSFPNMQPFLDAGAYHSSEIPEVFGTYPRVNATKAQAQLSLRMQKVWSGFARDPQAGPGWPALGTAFGKELQEFGFDGKADARTINLSIADYPCPVWDPLYTAL